MSKNNHKEKPPNRYEKALEYKVTHRPQFEKSIKKLKTKNSLLVEEILAQADLIQKDPSQFEKLTGNLKGLYSAHFHRNPEYRMLFKVYECRIKEKKADFKCSLYEFTEDNDPTNCKGLIDFIFVETREEFNRLYKLPKKLLAKFIY